MQDGAAQQETEQQPQQRPDDAYDDRRHVGNGDVHFVGLGHVGLAQLLLQHEIAVLALLDLAAEDDVGYCAIFVHML